MESCQPPASLQSQCEGKCRKPHTWCLLWIGKNDFGLLCLVAVLNLLPGHKEQVWFRQRVHQVYSASCPSISFVNCGLKMKKLVHRPCPVEVIFGNLSCDHVEQCNSCLLLAWMKARNVVKQKSVFWVLVHLLGKNWSAEGSCLFAFHWGLGLWSGQA